MRKAQRIRNTKKWRDTRRIKLKRDPLCEDPFLTHALLGGGFEPATEVHHIRKIESDDSLAFAMDNLASLCDACHDKISGMERAGKEAEAVELFSEKERARRAKWK